MEGLQDAIQDAQYMGEMCDDTPLPVTRLELPPSDTVEAYHAKLKRQRPAELNFTGVIQQDLGYWFFRNFVKMRGDMDSMDFLAEVENYRILTRDSLRVDYAQKIVARFTKSILGLGGSRQTAHPTKRNVGQTDTSILYRRGRTHRFACMRHMEKDKTLIGKVEEVLKSQTNSNILLEDSTTVGGVDGGAGTGSSSDHQAQKKTLNRDRRSFAGISGSSVEDLFNEFDFLEEALTDVYDKRTKHVKKTASAHGLLYETKKLPVQLFDYLQAVVLEKTRRLHFNDFLESDDFFKFLQYKILSEQKLGELDFAVFRKLGRGGFGAVYACKRMNTGHLYAMKVMDKRRLKEKHAFKVLKNERLLLEKIDSPFLVCMSYAYLTEKDIVFVLDLMQGGDLQYHIAMRENFWPQAWVQFWAAQVILGLEHLHERNIVYRDLKPENVLLDQYGNCCISDFGLACHISSNGLKGKCGTRGFWSPEMLSGERYFLSTDWWSFGCFIYALIHGKSPFRTSRAKALKLDKNEAIDYATLNMEVEYPEDQFTDEASDLISKLLERNPKTRLGKEGAIDIKKHFFFNNVNWGMLSNGDVEPPFTPNRDINAASQDDIGEFTKSKAELTPEDIQMFQQMEFVSSPNVQKEFVQLLQYEHEHGPVELQRDVDVGCCTVV